MLEVLYFLLAFLFGLLGNVLLSIRYKRLLKSLKEDISTFKSFTIFNVSQTIAYLSPLRLSSVFVKPVFTKILAKVPIPKSLSATIFENVYDNGWQIILLPLLLIMVGSAYDIGATIILLAAYIVGLFLIYRFRSRFMDSLMKIGSFVPGRVKRHGMFKSLNRQKIRKYARDSLTFVRDKRLFAEVSLLTLMFFLTAPTMVFFSALVFGEYLGYFECMLIYWISMIVGRVSGIPGGFGTREVTMGGLLLAAGMDPVSAVGIVFVSRIIILIIVFSVGGFSFLFLGKEIKQLRSYKLRDEDMKS